MIFKKYKETNHHQVKKENFKIKLTTYVQGDLKNAFMSDCIYRGVTEAELLRAILSVYYDVLKNAPFMVEERIPEIKNWIIDKIRFK